MLLALIIQGIIISIEPTREEGRRGGGDRDREVTI